MIYKNGFIILKITIALVFILMIVILQACNKQKTKYALVIDNSVVSEECICIQNNSFKLPLVCVLKEIGIDICWVDDDNAEFQWNDADFLLSLKNKNLIRKSDGSNLIMPPPGGGAFICEVDYSEKEIILDDDTLHAVLQLLGIKAYFNADRDNELFCVEIIRR